MLKRNVSVLLLGGGLLVISGCASSTMGPGAGTTQGLVNGSVDEVSRRSEDVFKKMNIQEVAKTTKNDGNERQLEGKIGDENVFVTLDNASNGTTNVEVEAKKSVLGGDKALASEILNKIVIAGQPAPAGTSSP